MDNKLKGYLEQMKSGIAGVTAEIEKKLKSSVNGMSEDEKKALLTEPKYLEAQQKIKELKLKLASLKSTIKNAS